MESLPANIPLPRAPNWVLVVLDGHAWVCYLLGKQMQQRTSAGSVKSEYGIPDRA